MLLEFMVMEIGLFLIKKAVIQRLTALKYRKRPATGDVPVHSEWFVFGTGGKLEIISTELTF